MSKIALKLQRLGYILRSGGADGADHAFESAITDVVMEFTLFKTSLNQK